MHADASDEREIRAARNQSLFRAVNEKLAELSAAVTSASETFAIACECADVTCVDSIEVPPDVYAQVRANPRRFVVLRDHVTVEVEDVVAEADDYVVVEKVAQAASVAEDLA